MKPCNIFQIQRLSVNDGDGIRSTVFFKGCNLRCRWCANPESWSFTPQLMFLPHKCTGCGNCMVVCRQHANSRDKKGKITFNVSLCLNCGACQTICPTNARYIIGQPMTTAEIINEVKKDLLFYESSGGGVTFSGGEPFLQPQYLGQLIRACQKLGINTAVESCGNFDLQHCRELLPEIDQLFFDIKLMDSNKHRYFTGYDNEKILTNITSSAHLNNNIVIRVPTICGVNADAENFETMCRFLTTHTNIKKIELLPYHRLGYEKMQALGIEGQVFFPPSEQQLATLTSIIHSYGLNTVTYK